MPTSAVLIPERFEAQLLTHRSADSAESVVRHLLAVQAQDPRGMRLAVRSRATGVRAADVDEALGAGSLVVSWLNRGTLHLVAAEDYWWLHMLTTPQLATGSARRLEQEGVSPSDAERGVRLVAEAVHSEGPQTRAQLRERLDAAGVPTARQALVHVLIAAALRGEIVRGPVTGGEQAFVAAADWVGPRPEALDRDEALAGLARRYLRAHGPADAADLARWAGIPLGQARRGFAGISGELEVRPDGLLELGTRASPARWPAPALLGAFDPVLLGWVSREPIVGRHLELVTTNGIFRPFALVDGRAVATWGLRDDRVRITFLEAVTAEVRDALAQESAAVLEFLGRPVSPPTLLEAADAHGQ